MIDRLKLDVSGWPLPQSPGRGSTSDDKPCVTQGRAVASTLLSGLKKCGARLRAAARTPERAPSWDISSSSTGGAMQGVHQPHVWGHGNSSTAPQFGPQPGSVTSLWCDPMGGSSLSSMPAPFYVVVLPPPQSSYTSIASAISQFLGGASMPAVSSSVIMPSYGSYGPGSVPAPPWLGHGSVPMAAGWHELNGAGYAMPAFANHGVPQQIFQGPGNNISYGSPPRHGDAPPRPDNGVVPPRRPPRRVVPLSSQLRNITGLKNPDVYLGNGQKNILANWDELKKDKRLLERKIEEADDEAIAEGLILSLDSSSADMTRALDESRSVATDNAQAGTKRQRTESENGKEAKKRQRTELVNGKEAAQRRSSQIPLKPRWGAAVYQPQLTPENMMDEA